MTDLAAQALRYAEPMRTKSEPMPSPLHPDWLIPKWPAPKHVRALCSTRKGGSSVAPYDSFNLGDHVGDDPVAVETNRDRLRQAMGARPVFLSQRHGTEVLALSQDCVHGLPADGCISDQSGLACAIMVADCLPVLVTDSQGSRVGAAHAGWRGLAGTGGRGILEQLVERFCRGAGHKPALEAQEIMAWLGPCIGATAFEVGTEVREAFVAHHQADEAQFRPCGAGKWLADLQGLACQRLSALGVTHIYGNDGGSDWCTVSQPSRFFSHRRDRVSGRMVACIWLD